MRQCGVVFCSKPAAHLQAEQPKLVRQVELPVESAQQLVLGRGRFAAAAADLELRRLGMDWRELGPVGVVVFQPDSAGSLWLALLLSISLGLTQSGRW